MDGGDAVALAGTLQTQTVGTLAQLLCQHDALVAQTVGKYLLGPLSVDEYVEVAGTGAAHVYGDGAAGEVGLRIYAYPVEADAAVSMGEGAPGIGHALGDESGVVCLLRHGLEHQHQQAQ